MKLCRRVDNLSVSKKKEKESVKKNEKFGLTWSIACIEKLKVINSQIGLSPFMAAPAAMPAKPISVIGVSITRLGPNFSRRPRLTYSRITIGSMGSCTSKVHNLETLKGRYINEIKLPCRRRDTDRPPLQAGKPYRPQPSPPPWPMSRHHGLKSTAQY